MMERILVVLNREETALSTLCVAQAVAARLKSSKISVLCPRLPEDPSFMPTEEVMTDVRRRQFNRTSGASIEHLRTIFATWKSSIQQQDDVRWLEVIGEAARSVGAEATQADLVIHGHLLGHIAADVRAGFHAALFDAAAPVIVACSQPPPIVAARPVIAWERTQAVGEAISAALPLLVHAECVTIISAAEWGGQPEPPPAGILNLLEDANVPYRVERFELQGRRIGQAILAEAQRHEADLIVMGAYTHNPLMERLLGGATQELLAQADIPLLLHH
jgi:nucleotide-binding universal stress UspA family protein